MLKRLIYLFVFLLSLSFNLEIQGALPEEIVICASTPIPDGMEPTRDLYEDIIKCGFNMGMATGSVDYFKKQFNLINGLNIKFLIGSGDLLTDKRKYYISAFSKNKNFAGWKFKDEPKYSSLNELKVQYDAMYKADPKNLIYINLVGVVNETFTGRLSKFSDYLNLIQSKFSPEIWSYDYYPILIKNGKLQIMYDQFYSDLEDFKAISQKTGKPFWAYCESMEYKTKSYSRPAANEAYLKFEAFSALAYGAQGIIYWTYGQRKSGSTETYLSALVNMDGKKTPAWYAAQKVNNEIKKFNDVFYKCKVKDVRHTGTKLYKGTKRLTGEFGPFKSVKAESAGVLSSLIENNGKQYIVFVNHDVQHSQKLNLELKPLQRIKDLTPSEPKEYSAQSSMTFSLDKGGILIFQVA